MISFEISLYQDIQSKKLNQGVFLWISHADKIPPHIGISFDGNYFSIKVNGKDDTDCMLILRIIKQKKIPSILVEIVNSEFSSMFFQQIKDKHEKVIIGKSTCLNPLLELFKVKNNDYLLADFLTYLLKKELIINYFGINLPENYAGIKFYSKKDVSAHLLTIEDVKRTKHIS